MPGPNKEMARVARNLMRENEDVRLTVKALEARGVLRRKAELENHRDNTRRVQLFKCANRLCSSHGIPSRHKKGLQHHECEKDQKE